MIGIIDYGAGNLASVENVLESLAIDSAICSNPADIHDFDRIILPGVGAFSLAMELLNTKGWSDKINEFVATKKPLLGICLGMQVLFEEGEENGLTQGLGLIKGRVVEMLPEGNLKIPHVGWNNLSSTFPHPLLSGIKNQVDFYFVHSYQCIPHSQSDVFATCDYGGEFAAFVSKKNVAGVQFHPEKSQPSGLRMLRNFSEWLPEC